MHSDDTPQQAAAAPHDSAEEAFRYACRLLRYRDRSTAELTRRLRMRGFSDAAIRNALRRLADQNLVNDERFAREYRTMQLRRGRSPRLIAALLRREHSIGNLRPNRVRIPMRRSSPFCAADSAGTITLRRRSDG